MPSCRPSVPAWTLLLLVLVLGGCSRKPAPAPAEPAPPGQTPVTLDPRADALAAQLARGGVEALPALREALAAAGIVVRPLEEGGAVTPAGAQGLALAEHDPEALALMQARTAPVPLTALGELLAAQLPGAQPERVSALLLEGVRAQAASEVPELRMWAHLVVGLSRHAPEPLDLLSADVNAAQVQLDGLQRALLMLRVAGDLGAQAQAHGAGMPVQVGALRTQPPARHPCTFDSLQGTVVDGAAVVLTTGFGQLLEYLDGVDVDGAEKWLKRLTAANAVIAYVKTALLLGVFHMDVTLDATRVVRTQSTTQNGEGPYAAKVSVRYEFPTDVQYLNCVRLALNHLGLDVSVPNAGIVQGADVRWRLAATEWDSGAERLMPILQFLGGEQVMHDKTDATGAASVRFEGLHQRHELGTAPLPVEKPGRVDAVAAASAPNVASDLVSVVGTALGGAMAGPMVVPELFNRMFPLSGSVHFPIRDWLPNNRASVRVLFTAFSPESQLATSSSYVLTPLFDEGLVLPIDASVRLRWLSYGSGTYVGLQGPAEDDKEYCIGRWRGSWEDQVTVSGLRHLADGSVQLDWYASGMGDWSADLETDPNCEPISPTDAYPWEALYGTWNRESFYGVVLPPGTTTLTIETPIGSYGESASVVLDLRGMLPARP